MKQMMTLLKVVNCPQSEVITDGWPRERPTQPLEIPQYQLPFSFWIRMCDLLRGHDFEQDWEDLESLFSPQAVSNTEKALPR